MFAIRRLRILSQTQLGPTALPNQMIAADDLGVEAYLHL